MTTDFVAFVFERAPSDEQRRLAKAFGLTPKTFTLFVWLAAHYRAYDRPPEASALSEKTGLGLKGVYQRIMELQDLGLVRRGPAVVHNGKKVQPPEITPEGWQRLLGN